MFNRFTQSSVSASWLLTLVVLAVLVVVPEKGTASPSVVMVPVVVVTGVRGLDQETDDQKQRKEQGLHEI